MSVRYAVIFEQAANNWAAYVPDLPGCITTGATLEETERNIREAIEGHLETLREYASMLRARLRLRGTSRSAPRPERAKCRFEAGASTRIHLRPARPLSERRVIRPGARPHTSPNPLGGSVGGGVPAFSPREFAFVNGPETRAKRAEAFQSIDEIVDFVE